MSEQTSDQPQVVAGQVRVECRIAIWMRCPLCHQEHGHVLTARDHLRLSGPRYWHIECHGTSFFLRLSAKAIASALARAVEIGAEHDLSQRWYSDENYECSCSGIP